MTTHTSILRALNGASYPMTNGELHAVLGTPEASIRRMTLKLVAKGLIEQVPNELPYRFRITDAGRA